MADVWGWERITPWTLREIMLAAMFAVGCGFTTVVTAGLVTGGHWEVDPVAGTLGIYGFLGVWLTAVWRMMRTGFYGGRRIETPIQRRTGWSTWGMTKNIGPVLNGDTFDRVVEQLHQHLPGS